MIEMNLRNFGSIRDYDMQMSYANELPCVCGF